MAKYQECLGGWAQVCEGVTHAPTDENGGSPIMIQLSPLPGQQHNFGLVCTSNVPGFPIYGGATMFTSWPSTSSTAALLVALPQEGAERPILFGDGMGSGTTGFDMLEVMGFDTNGNGVIEPLKGEGQGLYLWQDGQRGGLWDGIAQAPELQPLGSRVRRLWLHDRDRFTLTDSCNNYTLSLGIAQLVNGKVVVTADWYFITAP